MSLIFLLRGKVCSFRPDIFEIDRDGLCVDLWNVLYQPSQPTVVVRDQRTKMRGPYRLMVAGIERTVV